MEALITVMVIFFAWALVAGRLARWSVGAPLAMAIAGALLTAGPSPLLVIELETSAAERGVEIVLALLLFVDATEVPAAAMRQGGRRLPGRLLGIALPLSLMLAWVAGMLFFRTDNLWLLAVLATMVVPSDMTPAGPVIKDTRIPRPIRDALNVESGLNDGIVAPIFLWCLAGATVSTGGASDQPIATALLLAAPVLLISTAVGLVIGVGGGWLVARVHRAGWTQPSALRLGVLAMPFLAYGFAVSFAGNGFIAAFVAGVAVAPFVRRLPHDALHLSEDVGTMFLLILWFIFGQVITDTLEGGGLWAAVPYALVALTVVRMVPVAISMLGARVHARDVLVMGWMGPRGLASIVFGLLAYIQLSDADGALIADVMVATVGLSVILHGLTARLMGTAYERGPDAATPADPPSRDQPT